jgi:hypothetical protein
MSVNVFGEFGVCLGGLKSAYEILAGHTQSDRLFSGHERVGQRFGDESLQPRLAAIKENQLVSGKWTPGFYGYDGQGNVRFLANTAGTMTDAYQLTPVCQWPCLYWVSPVSSSVDIA